MLVDATGERSFVADRGAADLLGPGDLRPAWFRGAGVLHLPAYSLLGSPLGEAAARAVDLAREAGARVAVDLASAAPLLAGGRPAAQRLVRDVAPDLLFTNAAEAAAFLGDADLEGLLAFAPVAVVKRGAGGATVLARARGGRPCGSRSPPARSRPPTRPAPATRSMPASWPRGSRRARRRAPRRRRPPRRPARRRRRAARRAAPGTRRWRRGSDSRPVTRESRAELGAGPPSWLGRSTRAVVRTAGSADAEASPRPIASWRAAYRGDRPDWPCSTALDLDAEDGSLARGVRRAAAAALARASRCAEPPARRASSASSPPAPARHAGEAGLGEVWAIYVDPEAQGRGVGRALMDAARPRAGDARLRARRSSGSSRRTPPARGFYERMGWAPDGAAKPFEIGGAAPVELRYRRRLP